MAMIAPGSNTTPPAEPGVALALLPLLTKTTGLRLPARVKGLTEQVRNVVLPANWKLRASITAPAGAPAMGRDAIAPWIPRHTSEELNWEASTHTAEGLTFPVVELYTAAAPCLFCADTFAATRTMDNTHTQKVRIVDEPFPNFIPSEARTAKSHWRSDKEGSVDKAAMSLSETAPTG